MRAVASDVVLRRDAVLRRVVRDGFRGGAGAVGLAALQVALAAGARVAERGFELIVRRGASTQGKPADPRGERRHISRGWRAIHQVGQVADAA